MRPAVLGLAAGLVLGAALLVPGGGVRAARYDPDLALVSASAIVGAGSVALRFEGSVLGADLVQHRLPLQLLVYGTSGDYLRYDITLGAFTGTSPGLQDEFGPAEALALLATGTSEPGGAILYLGAGRIDIRAPWGFSVAERLSAVIFLLEEGEVVLSNTVDVEVLSVAP